MSLTGAMGAVLIACFLILGRGAPAHGTLVEGVVLAEAGPLESVRVEAFRTLAESFGGVPVATSEVGEKPGFYRLNLPAGTYVLVASGTHRGRSYLSFHGANPVTVGNQDLWIPFTATPVEQAEIRYTGGTVLSGTVTFRGKPVADAQVSLYDSREGVFKGVGLVTRTTDAAGAFSFSPLPGRYILVARKRMNDRGEMPLRKGDLFCWYGANPLVMEEGRETLVRVACHPKDDLPAFLDDGVAVRRTRRESARFRDATPVQPAGGAEISGLVTDTHGKPMAGLTVSAYGGDQGAPFQMHAVRTLPRSLAVTGADGTYRLALSAPGTYHLVARERTGEAPLKGEVYGLYEGNADHAVTVGHGGVDAPITVGRVMDGDGERPAGSVETVAGARLGDTVITRDTVWSGDIRITGRVVVRRGVTLTLTPGTTVRFGRFDLNGDGIGDGELRILGRIAARGTPSAPVRFASAEKEPRAGDWSYLLIFTSGAGNVLEHCIFEHAFSGLQVHFSRAAVRDSLFTGNREGIRFGRAEMRIEHNRFSGNDIGIRHHRLEGPVTMARNEIIDNEVGIFFVPSGQNTVDFSPSAYAPDPRYVLPPDVRDNTIAGNRRYNYQVGERQGHNIPLAGNWWGSAEDTVVRSGIFDRRSDADLGEALIAPWLTEPAAGAGIRKGY